MRTPKGDVVLNILNTNDFHGRIDANTVGFAGTVEKLRRDEGNKNSLFLSAGDNFGASLFASATAKDKPTIDVMNALDLKGSSVGNHEFDKGKDDLLGRVSKRADYDYLAANVKNRNGNLILPAYQTYDKAGLTVGVIGAVTEEVPSLVSPDGIKGLKFTDPVDAVNKWADKLSDGKAKNGEADVILAEYHEGAAQGDSDSTLQEQVAAGGAFAKIVDETSPVVGAIFTGHTHKEYAWEAPIPGTRHRTRPVLQTGLYGANVGRVKLAVDPTTGKVDDYTARNVARKTATSTDGDSTVSAEEQAAFDNRLAEKYPRVAEVQDIVKAALAHAAKVGNQPVGEITDDITTAFTGGSYVNGEYVGGTGGKRDDRSSESTLGDTVANALRDKVGETPAGADFGVVNPGGLRADLIYAGDTASNPANTDGVVTYAEANSVLPFTNNLVEVDLTGAQFKDVLEEQWQTTASGDVPTDRPYLQLGLSDNVSYTYDASRDRGDRITSITVDGTRIDDAETYKVATFSFLATGGDNFRSFTKGTTTDSGLVDYQAWIEYLGDNSPVEPSFARRAVAENGLPDTVSAGDHVTFTLSKLDLTSLGSPKNTSVDVTVDDGEPLASFNVNDGSVDIDVNVPQDAAGKTLVVTADPSGTTVRVPIASAPAAGKHQK